MTTVPVQWLTMLEPTQGSLCVCTCPSLHMHLHSPLYAHPSLPTSLYSLLSTHPSPVIPPLTPLYSPLSTHPSLLIPPLTPLYSLLSTHPSPLIPPLTTLFFILTRRFLLSPLCSASSQLSFSQAKALSAPLQNPQDACSCCCVQQLARVNFEPSTSLVWAGAKA